MNDHPDAELAVVREALAGRYELEREIGHGGMATVYLARDLAHDRLVAVKVLRSEIEGEAGEARFLREIMLLARLQHPNIVVLHDSGIAELADGTRRPFFTMPYVAGQSLRDRMRRDPVPAVAESVKILREIADALAAAHAMGIIHRDLKPENVLLSQGHGVVSDFGISKAAPGERGENAVTVTGVILGTPAYMAPEQWLASHDVDYRADLYSIGVIAYELLTGTPPFAGRTAQQLLVAHATESPRPILEAAPELPPALASLVMRLLEKNPRDRPPSAAAVVASLDTVPAAEVRGPSARWRVLTALGIAAAAATGFVALWSVWQAHRLRSPGADGAIAASVAVLPFDNLSGDSTKAYFSDGMTEQIMYTLGKVNGIRVSPQTSAFAFRGRSGALREIGTQLHVRNVLEGSVRQAGTRLRVNARLVSVESGDAIWSDEYERTMSDVFQVQDDIARAIAAALQVHLGITATVPLAGSPTRSFEAYDLYLQGRYFYERRTGPDLLKAVDLFQRAIRADPTYARAWAGLSETHTLLGDFGYRKPVDVIPLAEAAATRAIILDSTSAEAYTARGTVRLLLEWQWDGARTALDRAIALDPRYVPARLFHAWYYVVANRLGDAEREMRLGVSLDPLSKIMNTRLGTMLQYQHRDAEAAVAYETTLALDSTDAIANGEVAETLIRLHRCAEALHAIRRAAEEPGTLSSAPSGFVLATCGRAAEARATAARLERLSEGSLISATGMAGMYAALGDRTSAFRWLEDAYANHDGSLFQMRVDPMYESLVTDPRFQDIVRRLKFP